MTNRVRVRKNAYNTNRAEAKPDFFAEEHSLSSTVSNCIETTAGVSSDDIYVRKTHWFSLKIAESSSDQIDRNPLIVTAINGQSDVGEINLSVCQSLDVADNRSKFVEEMKRNPDTFECLCRYYKVNFGGENWHRNPDDVLNSLYVDLQTLADWIMAKCPDVSIINNHFNFSDQVYGDSVFDPKYDRVTSYK